MGNCLVLRRSDTSSWVDVAGENKILRIVKTDGKMLEYGESILVRDLLMNFVGYGIGDMAKASRHLPPDYELRVGHIYYLLQSSGDGSSSKTRTDCADGSKRIKVIISKHQLEVLLSKKLSTEVVLASLQMDTLDAVACTTSWRPRLETILE